MPFSRLFPLLVILLVSACSDPIKEQINQQIPITEQRINALAQDLKSGKVRNANLINQYAANLLKSKPELSALINEFRKDATTQGPMFLALIDRLQTAKQKPAMFTSSQALYSELLNLYQAADPVLFSDALSDPLNVMADMSGGTLPRVNSLSKNQSAQANKAQDFGVGEQLIGNPNYGQWQTNSSGMSFWAWYGMYSMMGDIFGSRRVGYSDWGRSRNYSYYHDYGRTRYSSQSQLRKQTDIETRTKKSFAQRGQTFTSAYSKNRSGASSLSGKSQQARASASKFRNTTTNKSSYGSTSKKSSFGNASFRNSNTTTSRSFSRGK